MTSLASPRHLAALSLTALLALFHLSACQPTATPTADFAWQPADLRALQAPAGPDPAYELVAAYARLTPTDLELRFDFLGSPAPFGYDLYLFLDTIPGGTEKLALNGLQPSLDWDIALGFPAQGLPRAFDSAGSPLPIRPRILRDSVLDSATVRISRKSLPADPTKIRFQAFAVSVPAASAPPPGGLAVPTEDAPPVASSTGPLSVSGAPPETTARLLLSFWDAFPSATPAQALRRWDGAHTGPYGQRHGLGVLLSAAEQNGIPLALLDLKRADQLAALDAVGGLAQFQQSQRSGLLLLPDLLSSVPQDSSRAAGQVFGFSEVPFFYGPVEGSPPPGYKAAFGYLPTQAGVSRPLDWNGLRLAPLPAPLAEADPQVDEEGLTLPARQALLALALSSDPAGLVSLGGSLPTSAWGDSLIAGPAMRYIAGHPWIRVLDGSDLLKLPAAAGAPTCPDLLCLPAQAASPHQAEIRQTIQSAPAGLFKDLARQAYQRLTQPTGDEKLQALHASYIGQVGPLLAAARWHANPPAASESAAQPDCSTDLDWDGASECVLASARFFLVLSPQGGRLVFAAMRINGQPVQLIGPRSQFVVGLGDSLDWKPELGLAADPQEIPGAFADPFAEWQTDQVETGPGSVVFIHPQTGARKRFELTTQGIRVTIQGQSAPLQLPLALIDTTTYTPGGYGRYQAGPATPGSHTWSLGSLHLQVTSQGASFDSAGFTESSAQIIQPEDPNAGYPPGHYIPFPLAVLTFQPQDQLMIVVSLKNGD